MDGAMASAGAATNQAGESEEENSEGNWLVTLAKAMADIQHKFLKQAMKDKDTMNANTEGMNTSNGTQGGDADAAKQRAFLNAQGSFQANMQMFNMMTSMTNNMLKTLGQALNTLASQR
jgi:hypothetical protein